MGLETDTIDEEIVVNKESNSLNNIGKHLRDSVVRNLLLQKA